MTTNLAEQAPEFESAQMIRFPSPNDTAYVPPPDAVLPPASRKKPGRKKGSKNKAQAKAPKPLELTTEAPAQQLAVATPPGGAALPKVRFSRGKVDTLLMIFGAFACFLAGGAGGYFMTGIGQ